MHPWLIDGIPTYGVCVVAGLILAWLLARHLARHAALDPSRIDLLVPLITAAGIAGASLFGTLTNLVAPASQHGTVLIGSLLLATAAGIVYALICRIPLGLLGDVTAAPIALGIACGRIGCHFAGCCYGKLALDLPRVRFPQHSVAWQSQVASGLVIPGESTTLPLHPVQLYESLLCLVLMLLLVRGFDRRNISGERFLLLGIGYSIIRFALEFLRADNPPIAFTLTFSQVITPIVFTIALATLLLRRHYVDSLHLRVSKPLPDVQGTPPSHRQRAL